MKNLVVNSTILLTLVMLIIFPNIPAYLHLYNQSLVPKLQLSVSDETSEEMKILKGDIAYLEALLSRAIENRSNDNEVRNSHELNNSINLFFNNSFQIDVFRTKLLDDKLLHYENNNIASIYLKIPSPPPKFFS